MSTAAVPQPLLDRIAAALNHLLRQQPEAWRKLQPHAGKRVRFELGGLQSVFGVGDDGLLGAADRAEAAPDLVLRIDATELLAGFAAGQAPGMRGVAISGDAELAQAISWLLQNLRLDAEDDLARLLGDVAAHRLARAADSGLAYGRRWARQLERDTRDWLAEAPRTLVTRAELTPLATDIARLRDTLARLDKRIALQQQRRSR